MTIYTYDIEVFKYDWLIVFKHFKSGKYTIFHNDTNGLRDFINGQKAIYGGFNEKHYDSHIIKAICCGADNAMVKEINDFIIAGNQPWEHWFIKQCKFWFDHFDIMDDMQMGLSLKAIEGHLGMNIEETEVDFNIDRPLTEEELALTIKYCKHDVDTTEEVIKLRKDYLKNKLYLGTSRGLSPEKSLSLTNAKLTAVYLSAKPKQHDDEREYIFPKNLKTEYIPKKALDFFKKMYDNEIPDDELFKSKMEIDLGECVGVLGFGGIHSAIPNFIWKEGEE